MFIHKEGRKTILISFLILIVTKQKKLLLVIILFMVKYGGFIVLLELHRMTVMWCTTTYKTFGITAL